MICPNTSLPSLIISCDSKALPENYLEGSNGDCYWCCCLLRGNFTEEAERCLQRRAAKPVSAASLPFTTAALAGPSLLSGLHTETQPAAQGDNGPRVHGRHQPTPAEGQGNNDRQVTHGLEAKLVRTVCSCLYQCLSPPTWTWETCGKVLCKIWYK